MQHRHDREDKKHEPKKPKDNPENLWPVHPVCESERPHVF
jgi:hypothetical protein